jgi:negative regulator of genetic competence, sporulation and motility
MHIIQFIYNAPITDLLQRYNDPIFQELYEISDDYFDDVVYRFSDSDDILISSCIGFLRRVTNDDSNTPAPYIQEYIQNVITDSTLDNLSQILRESCIRLLILTNQVKNGNVSLTTL